MKVANGTLSNTGGVVDDIRRELEDERTAKKELEEKFNKMVSAPFFNAEAGESASRRAEKLEIELETVRTQD